MTFLSVLAIVMLVSMPTSAMITVGSIDDHVEAYVADYWPDNTYYVNPSSMHIIEIVGEHAYVSGHEGFRVIDVSNPANPSQVGAIEMDPESVGLDLAVENDFAYLVGHHGLQIIDVSNAANPSVIGELDTGAILTSIDLMNGVAYVSAVGDQFLIIDVSTPESPVEIGSIDVVRHSIILEIADDRAYIYDDLDGVTIFDVSVPSAPVEIHSFVIGEAIYDLVVNGGIAYATGRERLFVIDVSDPLFPVELASVELTTRFIESRQPTHLEVVNGIAYEADQLNRLRVVDVSNPSEPDFVGFIQLPGNSYDFEVVDGYAFVADWQWGLQVIDVSQPTYPAMHPSVLAEDDDVRWAAYGVAEKGGLAYVTSSKHLTISDVADPANPIELSQIEVAGTAYMVALNGDFAYTLGNSSVEIFDVSDPQSPTPEGTIDLSVDMDVFLASVGEFQVVDGFAYALNFDGILIIDVSDSAAPREAGFIEIHAGGFEVVDGIAYVASVEGIAIIDVSDPEAPIELGNLSTRFERHVFTHHGTLVTYPTDISVAGSYAYLAQGYGGIRVIDISNPAEPVEVGSFESLVTGASFYARYVSSGNGILLVSTTLTSRENVWVFDLTDPTMPVPMGIIPMGWPFQVRNFEVGDEGLIYLATISHGESQLGLVVVDLGPEYARSAPPSDAFQCYRARSPRRPGLLGTSHFNLFDTFGKSVSRAGGAREFCAPVEIDGLGIGEPNEHLACHDLAGLSARERMRWRRLGLPLEARWAPFEVVVSNEFGDAQRLTVRKPERLCAASRIERRESQIVSAGPSDGSLDHYQCYGVEFSTGLPNFDSFEASLSDAFSNAARKIGEPTRLCAPVDLDGQGVMDSGAHLTCYEATDIDRRLRRHSTPVIVNNLFGQQQKMTLRGTKAVCVPSDVVRP